MNPLCVDVFVLFVVRGLSTMHTVKTYSWSSVVGNYILNYSDTS